MYDQESFNCSQMTINDTSSIEEEDLTTLTINSSCDCSVKMTNSLTSSFEEDFTPITSSTVNSYNSKCSDNITNPLHDNCSGIINNPIFQESEDFYDCTQMTFNDTSSIEDDDFSPITSSTINSYNFDCSDYITNPLHSECGDNIANPIFQETEDFYDYSQLSFNDTSSIDEGDFTPLTSSTIKSIEKPMFGKMENAQKNKFTFYDVIKHLILN